MKKIILILSAGISGIAQSGHVDLTIEQKEQFSSQRKRMLEDLLRTKKKNGPSQEITRLEKALKVVQQSHLSLKTPEKS